MKKRILSVILLIGVISSSMPNLTLKAEAANSVDVYVTSKDGLNDKKLEPLSMNEKNEGKNFEGNVIRVFSGEKRQVMDGIGGAVTESSVYNINKLSDSKKKEIYDAYFSDDGADYSAIRTTIGSADFSVSQYSYNDTAEPDPELKNFSIKPDMDDVIPAIKRIQKYNSDIKVFSAPWAPPAWMKKSGVRRGQTGTAGLNIVDNSMNPKYYGSYANYFAKFIKAYQEQGIPIYSISLQNEAQNNPKWEACTWSIDETVDFIGNYLGPTLEKEGLNPKLLIWDWDKGNDPMHKDGFVKYNQSVLSNKQAAKYIDGIAFHWYAGDLWHEIAGVPMWSEDFYSLDKLKKSFPNIELYATEGCQEKGPWLRSWDPAARYIHDMIHDFEYGTKAWIDWNLVLDNEGGPTQGVVNKCHAPVMLDQDNNIVYNPSYYVLKRMSKSIRPGDVSIKTDAVAEGIDKTAFINEKGQVTLIMGNNSEKTKEVTVVDGKNYFKVKLSPNSMTTCAYNGTSFEKAE